MSSKNFEDLEIWKHARDLANTIYKLSKSDKFSKDFGLRDQIRRAAVSIPANIAEGFERGTNAEFKHFSMISRGSCGELRTHLYIAEAVGYLDKDVARSFIAECMEISSMLTGLSKTLKPPNPSTKPNESHRV